MKVAVFASNEGEKARNLYDFFKEGNRISLDILYTDNPRAPIIDFMKDEGIEVVVLTPDMDGAAISDNLRNRGVELLVIDDYKSALPSEVKESYGEAVVFPVTPQSAPLDVITTIDRINAAVRNQHIDIKAPEPKPASTVDSTDTRSDLEKEWAEVLEVDVESDDGSEKEPAAPEPPQYNEPQIQTPPRYVEEPPSINTGNPQYGFMPDRNGEEEREPMPDTYLVWSVIITLLCCLIPGIIAIIYSASVSSKYYRGDIEGAKRASRNAQIWCIVSIVTGIIWTTLYLPLSLLVP